MATERTAEARALARSVGIFHNISYYAPEMKGFANLGLPEYWRAYMAYRSAPMGQVAPSVVSSTFYNFAPVVVNAAIPSAWETTTPAEVLVLRDHLIETALRRALGPLADGPAVGEAADLLLSGIEGADIGARPLFAAHAELPVPTDPLMRLWHGCTLWREYRGDGHNLALAANGIDGVACHVLLTAKGVGGFNIINKIRGWTVDEWELAVGHLADRGLVDAVGGFTAAGSELRKEIEVETDQLSAAPRLALGADNASRLVGLLGPLADHLVSTGAVAGQWPPPKGVE